MTLIIPKELNFFDEIENKIEKNKGLFDTNLFIPSVSYRKIKKKDVENLREEEKKIIEACYSDARYGIREELDYFMHKYKENEKFRGEEKDAREYQERYFNKLLSLMDYSNFFSIERVLKECRFSSNHFLNQARWARYNSKNTKRRGSERLQAFKAAERINRQRKNGLDDCINKLEDRILKEACFGREEFYEKLFSAILDETKKQNIETNDYHTDQHLLANAFYLSAISQEHIDIYSFDFDLYNLFENSARRSINVLGRKYNILDVSVNTIVNKDKILVKNVEYKAGLKKDKKRIRGSLLFTS